MLSPSLVPENLLRQDFRAFREHATVQGLTPVIQDHKQVYQLSRYIFSTILSCVSKKPERKKAVYVHLPRGCCILSSMHGTITKRIFSAHAPFSFCFISYIRIYAVSYTHLTLPTIYSV